MSLYGGRTGAQLTISDALTAGYKLLLQPFFTVPILVIGVVVNLIVTAIFVPLIVKVAIGGAETDTGALFGGLVAGLVAAVITGVIGGILLNLYGQIYAVMASTGDAPSVNAAISRVGERWMAVLGAGLITAAISIVGLVVVGIVGGLLGGLGIIVFLVGAIALIYVGIRLSLAGWLAAESMGAMDAVKASWEITNKHLMLLVGWSIVVGIVVSILGAIAGAILGLIPLIGSPLASTLASAFGFGAGVTIYRRVKDA